MSITRRVIDATDGTPYAWDGLASDPLPAASLVLHPRTNKVFDQLDGHTHGQLPPEPLLEIPRTTWYERPFPNLMIVGYIFGPDGCVPIYRSNDEKPKNTRAHAHVLGNDEPPRRNWRARKRARASQSLAVPDDERSAGDQPE